MRAIAIGVALIPGLALAQFANPGFMAPDTTFDAPGVPAPNQRNAADTLFALLAAEGGKAEVAFAELAGDKAEADAVRDELLSQGVHIKDTVDGTKWWRPN